MPAISDETTVRQKSNPLPVERHGKARLVLTIIAADGQATEFTVAPVRNPISDWITAFRLVKRSDGTCYTVGTDMTCTCPDATYRRGKVICRHARALQACGLIPEPF